jgi:copper resistance protein C
MRRLALLAIAPLAAMIALPVGALAHPRLTAATPKANSTVSKPRRLVLVFSEALVAPLSGIELTMTGMPGMANHQPMPIRGFTTQVTDKTMTVNLPRALPAGTYQLTWHVVGADQHRIQNSYTFTAN